MLGLAALVKLVAPVPIVLALLLLQALPAFRRPRALAVGLAVAAAVALPWHVAMVALHGTAFTDVYFGYHLWSRATRVLVGAGAGAAYADWVFEREWPVIAPVLGGLVAVVMAAVRRRPEGLATLALLVGAALPLVASSTGLPHYLVPLLPGVALAVGVLVDRVEVARPGWTAAVAGAVLAAAFVAANGRDLLRPEYGAGTRDVCAALSESGLADDVAGTWNLHDPAVTWYCGRPGHLYADNPGVLAATRDIPMLKAWVVAAGDADLRALAAAGAVVVTRPEPLPELLARAVAAGVRPEVVVDARSRLAVRLSARAAGAGDAAP
jgi:4-amino-4-deoxy-L-arabinose transferase-like glycosyltransferase